MNNSLRRLWLKRALVIFIIAALLLIVWQVFFKRPFVQVILPEGTDTAQLRPATTDPAKTITLTKSGTTRMSTGTYSVTYLKDKRVVGLTQVTIRPTLKYTLRDSTVMPATNKMSTVMHNHAKMVTPWNEGYIYQDTETKGISYVNKTGTVDISNLFLLSQTPQDPDLPSADLNTTIAIQSTTNGAVAVTTTKGVFVAKSLTDVTLLRSSSKEFLYFTSSSYDQQTNRLFVLSAYKKEVFYYDLSKTDQGPQVLFTADRDINRVAANGGKVAVYFDDVPSIEPKVLAIYALTRQLAPVIVNASDGKAKKTLDDWRGTTLLSISDDGTYAAVKRKFATDMSIIELSGRKTFTMPGPDAGAWDWQGNKLFFGRGKALWSAEPATKGDKLTYVAVSDGTFNQLLVDKDTVLATTTDDFVEKLVSATVDISGQMTQKMRSATLKTTGYYITYTAFNDSVVTTVETRGSFSLGMEASESTPGQEADYQQAMQAIKNVPGGSGLAIAQKDNSIIRTYLYAADSNDQ